jgi:putative nucleotidyltransferase with HDIG domain
MLSVAAAMKFYAEKLGYDQNEWEIVGLIHDFDWEIHPDLDQHPKKGAEILRDRGWGEEIIRTIQSHYTEGTGVPREKPIDYALLACDDVTGLIIATTLVRPSKNIADVHLKSVRKKWKDRRFAAGVDREHVEQAVDDFSRYCFDGELTLWDHISNVLDSMKNQADNLDLDGRLSG